MAPQRDPLDSFNSLLADSDAIPGAPPVVLIGEMHWREVYDGDPGVVGSPVRVDGVLRTVAGVLPTWFRFPVNQTAWIPLTPGSASADGDNARFPVQIVGRLRDGVALEQAQSEMRELAGPITTARLDDADGTVVTVRPFGESFLGRGTVARIMLLVVSFVLLIASANAASLLMGRAISQRKEVAIRMALGGSRSQVRWRFLAEATVLAGLGLAGGICLAWLGVTWFDRAVLAPYVDLWWISVSVDGQALVFASACGLAAALLAGIAPALQASDVDLQDAMKANREGASKAGGRGSGAWLVAGQLSLSCTLLIFTTLLVRAVPEGEGPYAYDPTEITTGRLSLGGFDYPDRDSRQRFARALESGLTSVPGVSGVALTTALPGLVAPVARVRPLSGPMSDDAMPVRIRSVSPSFFPTFGMEVRDGSLFGIGDDAGADPAAVIDEILARRLAPGGSAVGLRVGIVDGQSVRIVGVVGAPEPRSPDAAKDARLFLPIEWRAPTDFYFTVSSSTPLPTGTIRGAMADLDPTLPIQNLESLHDAQAAARAVGRKVAGLFTVFGSAAFLMTMVGLYGTVASAARRRRKEIGLRRALGGSTVHLVMSAAGGRPWILALALVVGTGVAALLAPALQPALTGESAIDPWVFLMIPMTLALVSAVAIYVPSRRAVEADPMQELREG